MATSRLTGHDAAMAFRRAARLTDRAGGGPYGGPGLWSVVEGEAVPTRWDPLLICFSPVNRDPATENALECLQWVRGEVTARSDRHGVARILEAVR
ncbi:hypothetical protein Ppa06_06550 [Planomonospora parontospora subsp. parontospora]|uniref:Uncharacterized protein n=2 Tax=Planomonospora parontospora TaxID=58119 RepID=A0AA37BD64_9ACTN|nr:hypothetical protein GCM10010126_10060 [Planomonospora parontospora]GII06857.1 hypothetical protein Ppa06_06550 [Planomonospora parontospora subsp. parontospora]